MATYLISMLQLTWNIQEGMVGLSASVTRSALGHQHNPNKNELFELIGKLVYIVIGNVILNSDKEIFVNNKI